MEEKEARLREDYQGVVDNHGFNHYVYVHIYSHNLLNVCGQHGK